MSAKPHANHKSPVYGYLQKPTMVDFPGHLATVMFTSGCNFRCGFCHNAPLMAHKKDGLEWHKLETACRKFKTDWVSGVAISGGEPTLWNDQLIQLIQFFKGFGFSVKLDTNGSRPEVLRRALPEVDFISMDVKCSLEHYESFVGFSDTAKIKQSIAMIKAADIDHEFRTTIIPETHSNTEMKALAELVNGTRRYILQPFVPRDNLPEKALRTIPRTPPDRLLEIKNLIEGCADSVIAKGI